MHYKLKRNASILVLHSAMRCEITRDILSFARRKRMAAALVAAEFRPHRTRCSVLKGLKLYPRE